MIPMTDQEREFLEGLEQNASVLVSRDRYKQLVRDSETLQKLWEVFENCAKYQIPARAREIFEEEVRHD